MIHPDRVYSGWDREARWGARLLLRRPLLLALILGSTVSLMTSGRLTARLMVSGVVTWSFVPLLQMASLVIVIFGSRRLRPLPEWVDLFFIGQGPWLCWLIAFGAFWSSAPPTSESVLRTRFWFGFAAAAAAWSAYLDYRFFRLVAQRSRGAAVRDLFLQRAIAWGLGIVYFGEGSLWTDLAGVFGR